MEYLQYIILAVVLVVLVRPAIFADRSPIPETSGNVQKVTQSSELDSILSSSTSVVVDFYADWCPPCRAIAPIFSKLADEHATKGKLAFAKVNVDHVKDVAKRYDVSAMPSFLFFKNGKPSPVNVPSIKASRSVRTTEDGLVERVLGADVAALRSVVRSLAEGA
ncbi:thioredoxin-domain-containing protein [Aaosphaeria arxii CBS 175.79]|uniref:Thioredoxin-domain-containing protein n=1 Tax=Aaosphaeria arxii CBS 175.79 TaxID=1450172 RepID=A0A6A5XIY1_9PLEO|nr:thioredoxin-domain-containing protein [Aaosphaeria arxii CBS 175.79]KAF2012791.1 thioredoxin-domain-containing protein [Aaosphaeria arxii CBS 175.79]